MQDMLLGAAAMGGVIVSLFFLRFWRQTGDRLFLFFALSFAIDAAIRIVLALTELPNEHEPFFYLGRLFGFGLIALAIIDKNRSKGPAE